MVTSFCFLFCVSLGIVVERRAVIPLRRRMNNGPKLLYLDPSLSQPACLPGSVISWNLQLFYFVTLSVSPLILLSPHIFAAFMTFSFHLLSFLCSIYLISICSACMTCLQDQPHVHYLWGIAQNENAGPYSKL